MNASLAALDEKLSPNLPTQPAPARATKATSDRAITTKSSILTNVSMSILLLTALFLMRNSTTQDKIRDAVKEALGGNHFANLVSTEEAAAFESLWNDSYKTAKCCASATYPDFRLCLAGTTKCAWNKSAAIILADHIVARNGLDKKDCQHIRSKILDHTQHLRKEYAKFLKPPEKREQIRKTNARNTRRRTVSPSCLRPNLCTQFSSQLYNQRYKVTTDRTELNKHTKMLELLGIDGMSSDEDITESGTNDYQYEIHPVPFRSHAVTKWLRKMDRIHLMNRNADTHDRRRGNKPRHRVPMSFPETHQGSDRFVPELPLNFYDKEWLKLKGETFVDLHVRPKSTEYDFSLGELMEQYVS